MIENGIDTASFRYDADNRNVMLSQMKREGRKVVLHVTPSLTQKLEGGRYVFELARLMPEVTFVVVGHRDEHIGDLPGNIVLLPYISSPRELAGYYQTADATLLTSRRESFSQVTAESLCCGTPVVGFCAGATETIALREYSSFVTYGDVEQLKGQLEDFLFRSFDKAQISREACRRYDAEQMYAKYPHITGIYWALRIEGHVSCRCALRRGGGMVPGNGLLHFRSVGPDV